MSSRRSRVACLIACLAALAACDRHSSSSSPPPPTPGQSAPAAPAPTPPAAAADASSNEVDTPPAIPDADLPPLPEIQFMTPRPMEVVRAVYVFAAKHPEVLSKMPCFCGCQNRGHKHNDECFVASRDARGRPTAWEPHGAG